MVGYIPSSWRELVARAYLESLPNRLPAPLL